MESLEGEIAQVTYLNKENAYTVLKIHLGDFLFCSAVGIFPELVDMKKNEMLGMKVRLHGEWTENRKYGHQFEFQRAEFKDSGLLFFLSHIVKGLGKKLASELVKRYGEEELERILEQSPEVLLSVKGIKEKKLQKIVSSWNKYKQIKELVQFFVSHGVDNISTALATKIYKHFDQKNKNAIEEVKRNPYLLTDVRGIGFKTCDMIAMRMGIPEDSAMRLKALADYILSSASSDSGHTYLTMKQFIGTACDYLGKSVEDNYTELKERFLKEVFYAYPNRYYVHQQTGIVGLSVYRDKEFYILNRIKRMLTRKTPYVMEKEEAEAFIKEVESKLGFTLAPEQKKAVKDLFTHGYGVFILCGYAGTGKTTLSRIILEFFSRYVKRGEITCCAFTGMASKRIKDVTGFRSSTIHSLLGYSSDGFMHNEESPLPYKVILLDEASMVNVEIFHALVRAIPEDAVFIMVGDDAQLPPIGAGNVFVDLLGDKSIPKAKLTHVHRQSQDSVITHFASFIRKGQVPPDYYRAYGDWIFNRMDIRNYFTIKQEKSESEMREIREKHYLAMLSRILSDIEKTASRIRKSDEYSGRIRQIWEIQVITPMKNTVLGTKNLNTLLQKHLNTLNGKEVEIKNTPLKQHDKVIHLKNHDMVAFPMHEVREYVSEGIEPDPDEGKTIRVYNGALGLVVDMDEENELFYVTYPDTEGMAVMYDFSDFKDIIDLGYALTIHKTQGNQFKYVFMPLVNSFYIMLNAKLLYTAVTRTTARIHIYAQKFAFEHACKNTDDTVRQTFLLLANKGGGNNVGV